MEDRKFRKAFGTYISNLRKKRGYSLEQVCEGLCTAQQLSKFERGEKTVSKLLQDALLERLGIGAEDYEHYLNIKDYDHWKMRQRILYRIQRRNTAEARMLLNEYYSQYVGEIADSKKVPDRLEYQFYLSMQAQIRAQEGAGRDELRTLLKTALGLTVPWLWKTPPVGKGTFLQRNKPGSGSRTIQRRRSQGWTLHRNPVLYGDFQGRCPGDGQNLSQGSVLPVQIL